ncbi:MAG: DUF2279 domain-containing protein [Chitinophagaceae bacterium]
MKRLFFILFLCKVFSTSFAQDGLKQSYSDTTPSLSTQNHSQFHVNYKKRLYLISGIHIAGSAATMFILSQSWYKDFPKTSFHTFNDSREWLQVDKAGHAWTAYNIAKYSKQLWSWAGIKEKKAVVLGGVSSIAFQTILEYLDGHSTEWGWSWADMSANLLGAGFYMAQEFSWSEQRAQLKLSSLPIADPNNLDDRVTELYGKSVPERILKDYNVTNFWLSINLGSFAPNSKLPSWLNIAAGYGAKGLYGGFENRSYAKDGSVVFDRTDIPRKRQWYLSPDIDFTKIKTNKKGLKTLFSLANMIKIPAPTLEFSNGKFKGHWLMF